MTLFCNSRKTCCCMKVLLSFTLFNTNLFITAINASHFRGGSVWWKPTANFSEELPEIQVEFNIGWRLSFSNNKFCNDEMIENDVVSKGEGEWVTEGNEIMPLEFMCTEYDSDFDWMTGYNRFPYTVTKTSNVTIWNEGRCWIENLFYSGCEWSLSIKVNVGIRSDTNLPNSSPRTSSAPVVTMQVGCPQTIQIPTTDPNGDVVKCRFGKTYRECGNVCIHYPFFSLSEDCVLTYNGGGVVALATVAIIIEDYPTEQITLDNGGGEVTVVETTDPLSYIPLQFLVNLKSLSNPCTSKPTFVNGTPPNGQEISTVTGAMFSLEVYTTPSSSSENITEVTFQYPYGASKSALEVLSDNVYRVNISWIPTFDQLGRNIICFTSKDSSKLASEQRCLTVIVGGTSSPCKVNNGGCSEVCTTLSETTYICACPRRCWYLDVDGRTCRPNLDLRCEADTMTITLPTCAVDNPLVTLGITSVSSTSIPNECRVQSENDAYSFTMQFNQCSMRTQETFWEIKYWNVIRLFANGGSDDETQNSNSPITRGAWYFVPVSCSFSKLGNLTASFQPEDRKVDLLDVPGLGEFSFFLDFYNSSSFDQAIGPYDYPLSFTVNSDIYFGIRAVGGWENLQVFTDNCIALPGDGSTTSYEMLSDGCIRDSTMEQHNASSPMENHFSIRAFRFREALPSDDGPTVVNIQCSVIVCQSGDDITRCSEGCTDSGSTRRKRDVSALSLSRMKRQFISDDDDAPPSFPSNVTESPVQTVSSSGNIQIVVDVNIEPTDPPGDGGSKDDEGTSVVILVTAGIAGIAALLIIVVCAIIVYHNKIVRSRNLIMPEPPSHPTAAYVRDIYLPNVTIDKFGPQNAINGNSTGEFVWARRVISAHPMDDDILRLSKGN